MEAPWAATVTGWHRHRRRPGLTLPANTTNEGWGLLPGHQRRLPPGHQRGLFHGHGQRARTTRERSAAGQRATLPWWRSPVRARPSALCPKLKRSTRRDVAPEEASSSLAGHPTRLWPKQVEASGRGPGGSGFESPEPHARRVAVRRGARWATVSHPRL